MQCSTGTGKRQKTSEITQTLLKKINELTLGIQSSHAGHVLTQYSYQRMVRQTFLNKQTQ
jgi:hypothetical protein